MQIMILIDYDLEFGIPTFEILAKFSIQYGSPRLQPTFCGAAEVDASYAFFLAWQSGRVRSPFSIKTNQVLDLNKCLFCHKCWPYIESDQFYPPAFLCFTGRQSQPLVTTHSRTWKFTLKWSKNGILVEKPWKVEGFLIGTSCVCVTRTPSNARA